MIHFEEIMSSILYGEGMFHISAKKVHCHKKNKQEIHITNKTNCKTCTYNKNLILKFKKLHLITILKIKT